MTGFFYSTYRNIVTLIGLSDDHRLKILDSLYIRAIFIV